MENSEQRILEAAESEFLQKGYDGAKTTAIARRAGVTHAMLHYYFGSKERLYGQVLETKIRELGHSLLEAFTQPGRSLAERVSLGIGRHFDFLAAHPELPHFVLNEATRQGTSRELILRMIGRRVERVVAAMQQEADRLAAGRRPICCRRLLLDMVSLNFFTVSACPLLSRLYGMDESSFLAMRRQEIIETALHRIAQPENGPAGGLPQSLTLSTP